MPVITKRNEAIGIFQKAVEYNISSNIYGRHWNTRAIMLATKDKNKYGLRVFLLLLLTLYRHMPQAKILYCKDPVSGLLSHIGHMEALCNSKYAPYSDVIVLPHLDHADPVKDMWALTVGSQYFASVMFDAQHYQYDKNLELTQEYVRNYGKDVLVEGIIETLNVEGASEAVHVDNYCEAKYFVEKTKIDFLVADLGTEQQSSAAGGANTARRGRQLTEALQRKMLVLHGTSSLTNEQIKSLADDGVVRVNMWTRIARETGQYAQRIW